MAAEVTLREYVDQIRETLRAGRPAEAIRMCQHVLHHYPKHIQTYVLLGQALLDLQDRSQAGDILTLALAADPENVVAYVGLSLVHEAENMLDEAIWDMERAFEINPNHVEIREKLMRLRGQRDGIGRYRIKLSTGALGRLYAQGDLYTQAIQEFETVLRQEPTRLDMQLALAEALWRNRRPGDAVDLCQQILARAPNCLKANLLLGKIWQEMGMADEGHRLLQLAQELDPDNEMAQDMFEDQSPLPPRRVKLPAAAPAPTARPLPQPAATPAPMKDTAPLVERAPAPVPVDVSIPDWMRADLLFAEELTPPAPPAEPPAEIPSSAMAAAAPPSVRETPPSPMVEEEPAEPETPAVVVPEWMKSVLAETPAEEPPASPPPAAAPRPVIFTRPPSIRRFASTPEPDKDKEEGLRVASAFLPEEEFREQLGAILSEAGLEEGAIPDDEYRPAGTALADQPPRVVGEEKPLGVDWSKEIGVEHGALPAWLAEGRPPTAEEMPAAAGAPIPTASAEAMRAKAETPAAPTAPAWAPPPWLTGEWTAPPVEPPPLAQEEATPPALEEAAWSSPGEEPAPAAESWSAPAWGAEPATAGPSPVVEETPTATESWAPPPWLTAVPAVAETGEPPELPPAAGALPMVEAAPTAPEPWSPPPWLTAVPTAAGEPPEPIPEEQAIPPTAAAPASEEAPPLPPLPPEHFAPLEPPAIPTRERLSPDVLQEQVEHLLLEPNDYYARFIVASAYQESGKYDLALEHYEAIVQSAPSLPEPVVANLEAIVRAAPQSELAHRLLGDAYLKRGRTAEAMAQYNLAAELQ